MKKIAMIRNELVENIAAWDGKTEWHPEGYELVDVTEIRCHVGDLYKNGEFFPQESESV